MLSDEFLSCHLTRRKLLYGVTAVAGALATGSLLAACEDVPTEEEEPGTGTEEAGEDPAESDHNGEGEAADQDLGGTPVDGGTAVLLASQEGQHLVPAFSSFSTVIIPCAPFFNGLSKPQNPDLSPIPDLATDWDISDDGLDIRFNLRDDVVFHDGEPFTSEDVKFTWELIAHPDNTTGAQLFNFLFQIEGAREFREGAADEISGITLPDDDIVDVRLAEPWAPFLTVGSNQYIQPAHILKDVPVSEILEHEYARAPIGTGPFKFAEWRAGDSIIGEAFEDYFEGRPHLDRVVYRMIPGADANTTVSNLRTGEVNATTWMSMDAFDLLQDEPNVRTVRKPGKGNRYIEFNVRTELFEDVRVRKALSYALRRQEIAETLWDGRAEIVNTVFPPGWWPTKDDTTIYDNDPDRAEELLDEAGWVRGEDGIREKDGKRLSFTMYAIYDDWPLIVQEQWDAVGVEVHHEYLDFATMSSQYYTTHEFEAVALQIPYSLYTDPHWALPGYFLSENNRGGYDNPESDELIIAAASSNDIEERRELYYDWQEVIAQDVPHLFLGFPDETYAYSANLVTPDNVSGYFDWREVGKWHYVE